MVFLSIPLWREPDLFWVLLKRYYQRLRNIQREGGGNSFLDAHIDLFAYINAKYPQGIEEGNLLRISLANNR